MLAAPLVAKKALNTMAMEINTAEKSMGVLELLMVSFTSEGGWILDPLGGSGSTLSAAMLTGRCAVVVEVCEAQHATYEDRVKGTLQDMKSRLTREWKLPLSAIARPEFVSDQTEFGPEADTNVYLLPPRCKLNLNQFELLTVCNIISSDTVSACDSVDQRSVYLGLTCRGVSTCTTRTVPTGRTRLG